MGKNVYSDRSAWQIQTSSGQSLEVGISKLGLGANIKGQKLNLIAKRWNQMSQEFEKKELRINVSLTGLGAKFGISADLTQELTGVSVAYTPPDYNGNYIYLNSKRPGRKEMMSFDFNGPCSMVSYSGIKGNLIKDFMDYAGKTFIYFGQGKCIVDQSEDWLKRVVDNSTSSTLGGNFKKFNEGYGPFSNAAGICPLNLKDVNLAAKFETSIAMFSGTATVVSTD